MNLHTVTQYLFSGPGIVVLTLLASAAVDSMPAPAEKGSAFYLWLYGFAHAVMLHADKFHFSAGLIPPPAPPVAASPLVPPAPPIFGPMKVEGPK